MTPGSACLLLGRYGVRHKSAKSFDIIPTKRVWNASIVRPINLNVYKGVELSC